MTPEVWLYLNELKRYDDPQQIRRRRAQERAAQRQARIEAAKWYGHSPARPIVSGTPFMSNYLPIAAYPRVYGPAWFGVTTPVLTTNPPAPPYVYGDVR